MEELLLQNENKRYEKFDTIQKVAEKTFKWYVNSWVNRTLEDKRTRIYTYDNELGIYLAVDNRSGDCWVEEFDNEMDCLKWLDKNN